MPEKTFEANNDTANKLGLTDKEFGRIKQLLNRQPTFSELSAFATMWSESASLKNARFWLKTIGFQGKKIRDVHGESYLDIGDGYYCQLDVEANHPNSTLLPEMGIPMVLGQQLRRIHTQGLEPLGLFPALRAGNLRRESVQMDLEKAVRAIASSTHELGIPATASNTYFHDSFNQNLIFSSFFLGVAKKRNLEAASQGSLVNKKIILIGGPTRSEGSGPFFKFLIEEVNSLAPFAAFVSTNTFQETQLTKAIEKIKETGLARKLTSVGANGLLASLLNIGFNHNLGFQLDLTDVLAVEEIELSNFLLSESGARMVGLVEEDKIPELVAICQTFQLDHLLIGGSIPESVIKVKNGDEEAIQLELRHLLPQGNAPEYQREQKKPGYLEKASKFNVKKISHSKSYQKTANRVSKSNNTFSKDWLIDQLDSSLRGRNLSMNAPSDASLLKHKESGKILAFSLDGNASYLKSDPYYGAMISVSEAARNLAISGASPLGLSIAFHAGNPHDPNVYWQFVQSIKGINEACRKFSIPVLKVAVSFNNESIHKGGVQAIYPATIFGMVGLVNEDVESIGKGFKEEGDLIYMIGTPTNDVNASEYLKVIHSGPATGAPIFDLDEEFHIQLHLKRLIRKGMIESAHDIMEGGLFVTLFECAQVEGYGFNIETDTNFRKDAYLFGESQSRVLISIREEREDELVNYLNAQNVPFTRLGEVSGDQLIIDEEDYGTVDQWKLENQNKLFQTMEMP